MFLNLQGQDSYSWDFFDEKSQEQGWGLHSSPSYTVTILLEKTNLVWGLTTSSQVRTNLLQLIQAGVTSGADPPWCVQVTVTCWMPVVWFLLVATDWNSQQNWNSLLFLRNYVKQVPVVKHFTFYLEFSSFVVCLGCEANGLRFTGSYSGQPAALLAGTLKGAFCF